MPRNGRSSPKRHRHAGAATSAVDHKLIVTCQVVREAVSAFLDDEKAPIGTPLVESHLAVCFGCLDYKRRITALARRTRLCLHEPAPDLTAGILESLVALEACQAAASPWYRRRGPVMGHQWRRATRWIAAAAPLGVAIPALALGVFSHPRVVPSPVPSPCTVALAHHPNET
jgi:predicted anti-sigma-YlaC factor YlaD